MGLVDILVQNGEATIKNDDWWESQLFTSLLASFVSASVALVVVQIDHRKQRKAKETEDKKEQVKELERRKKKIQDQRNYFFEMCEALVLIIDDQIQAYEDTNKQVTENKYSPFVRKVIPSLNLDKIYYLQPTETFDLFVNEVKGDSKEHSKHFIKLYRQFDRIQGVKKVEVEMDEKINLKIEQATSKFFSTVQQIDTYKREFANEVIINQITNYNAFTHDIVEVFKEYTKKYYEENSGGKKTNYILFPNQYLLEPTQQVCINQDYLHVPYRVKLMDMINNCRIAMKEFEVGVDFMILQNNQAISVLKNVKEEIEIELKYLKNLTHEFLN